MHFQSDAISYIEIVNYILILISKINSYALFLYRWPTDKHIFPAEK